MFTEDRIVTGEIIDLLKSCPGPVKVKDIASLMGASATVINLSISKLIREGLIIVESRAGENFVAAIVHEVCP